MFLTICARHLKEPFNNTELAKEIISSLLFLRRPKRMCLYCYCLMPDHLHLVTSTLAGNLSKIIGDFKKYTTRIGWKHGIDGKLWQRSFYDHIARTGEDLVMICEYILANPVRKGLVERVEDWSFSALVDPLPL